MLDLATSDALQMARRVDPDGNRTIGVLTKMDIMDRGTDAMGILLGRQYPLRHGWIGVVNRSQHDINTNKSIEHARKDEMEFFKNHSAYSAIYDRNGVDFLAKRCSKVSLYAIFNISF